jgi:integrase
MARARKSVRHRLGKVSYYEHHGSWHVYYRDGAKQVRRRAGATEREAAQVAAQVQAQLSVSAPTLFSFTPVTVAELRRQWLEYHEHVLRSSLATISRYRAATQHVENFAAESGAGKPAHELHGENFVRYLRLLEISPNGHAHTQRRTLRDKGVRFILETCRSLYGYAAKKRHLPPYADNPFAGLGGKRFRIEDAKEIIVFDAESEPKFLEACGPWDFPIHFTLAKTGMRPGELCRLLIEEVDLTEGWLSVRNKPELGWRIKTGRERRIPILPEVVAVLKHVIGARTAGPIFLRPRFEARTASKLDGRRIGLAKLVVQRCEAAANKSERVLSRAERSAVAATVWRDVGALSSDHVRRSFIAVAQAIGLTETTCPKSWRHTFATLLQDANVDPLIRQLVLGHTPGGNGGALGMTSVYSHSRPETMRREILRALNQWPRSLATAAKYATVSA